MATVADYGVVVRSLRSGLPVGDPRRFYPPPGLLDAALSPDGRTLAVATGLSVQLIDAATVVTRRTLPGTGSSVWHVRFTPDGRFVVGGSVDGWARLWSAATGRPATRAFRAHTGAALWEDISPDGRTLATGGDDGTIRLFDLRTQSAVGASLPGVPNKTMAPLFTPDGRSLLAISNVGLAHAWNIRPDSWARQAWAVAGRRLSRAEFSEALPGRDYAPAC